MAKKVSSKSKGSSLKAQSQTVEKLPEISKVALAGRFAENVAIIPSTLSTFVLSSGFLEDEERFVMLPFVEMTMQGLHQGEVPDGRLPDDLTTLFSHTLPLENAVWLAFDLLHDFRVASERLESMVDGNLQFDEARMQHAIKFAELASQEATRCAAALKKLTETAPSMKEEAQ
jgi:hypothetical protein